MRKAFFPLLFVTILFTCQLMPASSFSDPNLIYYDEGEQPELDMPDISHARLVEHAGRSHGLPPDLVDWLSQGAWDEDHCSVSLYPPCLPGIPNGHHSWDPDTNLFWNEPAFWGDFGPGLTHAVKLFGKALEAYQDGNAEAAYLWLGRALHMIGDVSTPAHTLLDIHLPWDPDSYEDWLSQDDYSNTQAWISANPPGGGWDMNYHDLPAWNDLTPDLQNGLAAASQQYGGRLSGQGLWELGPEGEDRVIFQLMFLLAEEADNYDSDDIQGEIYHGDPSNPAYLAQIRDTVFPTLVRHSTALIAYFERQILPPPAPELLSPPNGDMVSANPPSFTWQAVGFMPSYQIEIDDAPGFVSPLVSLSITPNTYTPAALLPPGIYYWRVHATSTAGTGDWSQIWQFIIPWQVLLPLVFQTR